MPVRMTRCLDDEYLLTRCVCSIIEKLIQFDYRIEFHYFIYNLIYRIELHSYEGIFLVMVIRNAGVAGER